VAVNFLIVAAVLFLVIKAINTLKRKEAKPTPDVPADVKLLTEIRDLLATRK
jgi:large conductance mechanosensitive channel